MPIYPDNFQANSLSGSVLITDGHANISLTTNPYALEGDKSFVVKLRKGGPSGLVIATSSPVTLRDTSSIVSLTANISSVNEGNLVQFTLVTANAVDNSNVYYSVFPATANITTQDFFGANIGKATIISNQATFALRANADLSLVDETGENFRVQLRTNSPVGNIIYATSNVTILDVSKGFNILSFVENSSTVTEGGTLTLTFNATNIPVGTVFHYFTEGNATVSTFTGGNTGSFVMNGFSNTVTLLPTGVPYSTTQNFNVKLRALSNTGAVVATSNNLIVIDPAAINYIAATGGNVSVTSDGYKIHTYNTSGTFNVTNLASGNIEYLVVAGGAGGGGNEPNYVGGAGGGGSGAVQAGYSILSSTGNFTVTVGAGGGQPTYTGLSGSSSSILFGLSASVGNVNVAGGNGGGSRGFNTGTGGNSGSGYTGGSAPLGTFNAPGGGGGGGAGGNGSPATTDGPVPGRGGGNGGSGVNNSILGIPVYRGGGGGGGSNADPNGPGGPAPYKGLGGAGGGGLGGSPAVPGVVNSGGGGGGAGAGPREGSTGGSGVVIIKYPFVPSPTVSNVVTSSNVFTVGSNITFTVNAQNANLLTLYYSTDGNVIASNFIGGNTGSFVANASGGIVTLQANTNIPLNESRQFRLQIRQDSTTGFISGSSANVTIDGFALQMLATGGNVITADGYRTHIFSTSNNFVVSKISQNSPGFEYLIVAGGGGGGDTRGGGGGAGGYLSNTYTVSARGTYTITVGGGGNGAIAGSGAISTNGGNSIISGVGTASGGGKGRDRVSNGPASPGGSGGGGGADGYYTGGSGTPGQGNPGGNSIGSPPTAPAGYAGGGGGAGAAGSPAAPDLSKSGDGGIGKQSNISGSNVYYAGGGGGDGYSSPGIGGLGGGASGQSLSGNVFTGGGGGGGRDDQPGGAGGSGIVIIRYPYS